MTSGTEVVADSDDESPGREVVTVDHNRPPGEPHYCSGEWRDPARDADATLIAAAPVMARALLAGEWWDRSVGLQCTSCYGLLGLKTMHGFVPDAGHERGCLVDEALKAAGFPDQASRDEARRRIAESKA